MQRMQSSFYKECKRTWERFVLLKRMEKNARTLRSFEKNGCPTLVFYAGNRNNLFWGQWIGNPMLQSFIGIMWVCRSDGPNEVVPLSKEPGVFTCTMAHGWYTVEHCYRSVGHGWYTVERCYRSAGHGSSCNSLFSGRIVSSFLSLSISWPPILSWGRR